MERTFSPMIRQYSAIDGLQKAYTLVYAMEVEGTQGCRLTLCRLGSRQRVDSQYVAAAPELCENGVQPEIWQDVVTELTAVDPAGGKGGAWCEQ